MQEAILVATPDTWGVLLMLYQASNTNMGIYIFGVSLVVGTYQIKQNTTLNGEKSYWLPNFFHPSITIGFYHKHSTSLKIHDTYYTFPPKKLN